MIDEIGSCIDYDECGDGPTLCSCSGGASHPHVQRANALLSQRVTSAASATISGAAHFMIASHAGEVARRVADHVHSAHVRVTSPQWQPVTNGKAFVVPAIAGSTEVSGTKQTLTWKLRNVRIKGEADIPVIARRRPLLAQSGPERSFTNNRRSEATGDLSSVGSGRS